MTMCSCATGCALNPMADRGAFGDRCPCWCHKPKQEPVSPSPAGAAS